MRGCVYAHTRGKKIFDQTLRIIERKNRQKHYDFDKLEHIKVYLCML